MMTARKSVALFGGVALLASSAAATVDLNLKQEFQVVNVGDIVELNIVASASGSRPSPFDAADAIIEWDPSVLSLIGSTQVNAGAFFFAAGFLPDPDGVNSNLTDGDAIFTALVPAGTVVFAPPGMSDAHANGLIITTLRFTATAPIDTTVVRFLPEIGLFGSTRVLLQGFEVTGDVDSAAKVVILGVVEPCPAEGDCLEVHETGGCDDAACCELVCDGDPACCEVEWDVTCVARACTNCVDCFADLNGDSQVDGADLGMLLVAWSGSGCGDFNYDGTIDGADLGELLAAWGPCPR